MNIDRELVIALLDNTIDVYNRAYAANNIALFKAYQKDIDATEEALDADEKKLT